MWYVTVYTNMSAWLIYLTHEYCGSVVKKFSYSCSTVRGDIIIVLYVHVFTLNVNVHVFLKELPRYFPRYFPLYCDVTVYTSIKASDLGFTNWAYSSYSFTCSSTSRSRKWHQVGLVIYLTSTVMVRSKLL